MNLCIYQNLEKRLGRFTKHDRRACTIAFLSRVKQHVGQKIRQKSIVIRFPAAIHRCLGSEISYSNCPFFSASLKVALLAI